MGERTLVWFRGKDLRVTDHTPLARAAERGEVIPVFVFDPYFFSPERAAELPHRMQFLLESIRDLAAALAARGSQLVCVSGRSVEVIPRLAQAWGVTRVVAHRWVEPFGRTRDARIEAALSVPFDLFEGETLHPPGTLRTGKGTPYSVFTPFSRALRRTASIGRPQPAPKKLEPVPAVARRDHEEIPTLAGLGLTRNPRLQAGGETAAQARLSAFSDVLAGYVAGRDRLAEQGTSRLSADLKFGTLSVRSVWWFVQSCGGPSEAVERFCTQLVWRDFAHATLWDRPQLLNSPFRSTWEGFPWRTDPTEWTAWTEGLTGYPVVDAAARQLLETGYVHNRARMITASFLCKHLLVDYRRGEAHFMRYLTDGDWAQNNLGWQWSAGSGCDAQPYFRVFNPISQGERFDRDGTYVRRWLPVLAQLPKRYVHQPWTAPEAVLRASGVELGENYPRPIVDHAFARGRFLATAKEYLGRARS